MKKVSILVVAIVLMVSCKPTKYADLAEGLYANMSTNKGDILLKLYFQQTPVTVANFVSLADGTNDKVLDKYKGKPYYDGLTFHRVIKDFMIQGGDPEGTGMGGPGYSFIDEFPKNENGDLIFKHDKAGILSMANSGPETNGSQFFITHKETPWLDGKHTVFGNVVKGQEVVDSISQQDTITKVEIIKVGKEAKQFNASKVFSSFFNDYQKQLEDKEVKKELAAKTALFKLNNALIYAKELPSGLKIAIVSSTDGEKPADGSKALVNYAGYFTDGKLFDTSYKDIAKDFQMYDEERDNKNGYRPLEVVYGPRARLIPGFKEALEQMKKGDKAVIYIPSHLGYGAQGAGNVIPPNTDLLFELEIVDE